MQNTSLMFTQAQIVAALKKVENRSEFVRKHDLAERTIYNLLDPKHNANRTTLRVLAAALMSEGLLNAMPSIEPPKSAAWAKRAAAKKKKR